METPYSIAWKRFRASKEYRDIVNGIGFIVSADNADRFDRFVENRFRIAFDAGYNAKTSSILDAINQTLRGRFGRGRRNA